MKSLGRISNNRALLVLSAVGLLCASSGLISAQGFAEGRYSVDFDAKTNTRDASKTNRTKVKVAPGEKRGQATWAARYIQGGTGAFATNFKTRTNTIGANDRGAVGKNFEDRGTQGMKVRGSAHGDTHSRRK